VNLHQKSSTPKPQAEGGKGVVGNGEGEGEWRVSLSELLDQRHYLFSCPLVAVALLLHRPVVLDCSGLI